jgi:uncharacterized protein YdeI (YjbR/CyaY-like superfamily)
MGKKDPRIDAYISKAPEFARPILSHIRELIHAADPQIEESLKWSCPHFVHNGIVCGMAAFKNHCGLNFWKGKLILASNGQKEGMGHFGKITRLSDLPKDSELIRYIKEAVRLNEQGITPPSKSKSTAKKELVLPGYFTAALKKNKKALNTFQSFSHSHRKEYIEWITGAKREETRQKRISTALEWLSEGKPLNWRYERC